MIKKLLALLLLPAAAHAVTPWESCPSGTAPMVRNPVGNESGLTAQFPAGDYYPDEVQTTVQNYQSSTCAAPRTWSETTCVARTDNNNYVCSKQCMNGSSSTGTTYATGTRVCGESTCPLTIGAFYPGDSFSGSVNESGEACFESCTLQVHDFGLSIGGSSSSGGPTTVEVTAATCDRSARSGYSSTTICAELGGQYVCQHPGEPTPCLEINGVLTCMPGDYSSAAICSQTSGCSTESEPVVALSDGAQVAPSATPSPPAPDTGTTGTRANPDFSFSSVGSDGSSTSYDYWSSGVVAGSTTASSSGGGSSGGSNGADSSGGSGSSGSGNSLTGGTSCEAPPSCSGDPIACYSAQQAWLLNCSQQPPTPGQLTAEAERFTDPTPEDGTILDRVTYDVTQLTVPYTPGACPSDIPIDLGAPWNRTVSIPLSQWCELLTILGAFVHLSAALIALRILAS
ncbi:MAG: hypothetical protein EPN60_04455 [Nevskiaceae bacterium]|nr:MAG: hypothetical protein EPO48_12065 [Nevskiaceae bacterium]TAM31429.1 MAG: hypothetical protein EPN60_04455 [Nevskiaceae bacterium]